MCVYYFSDSQYYYSAEAILCLIRERTLVQTSEEASCLQNSGIIQ